MPSSGEGTAALSLLYAVRRWWGAQDGTSLDHRAVPGTVATRHGVAGLLVAEPAEAGVLLRRHRAMVEHAARIGDAFGAHGVAHAVIRGPVSSLEYPRSYLRSYADIDLLVAPRAVPEVVPALARIGLRQGTPVNGVVQSPTSRDLAREAFEKRLHAFIGPASLPGGGHLVVEVHHHTEPAYLARSRISADDLLRSVGPVTDPVTGIQLPALGPHERAVELSIHLAAKVQHLPALRKRRDLRLGLYVDLALLLRHHRIRLDAIMGRGHDDVFERIRLALDLVSDVLEGNAGGRETDLPVYYFTRDGRYRPVARLRAPFEDRLAAGSSVPFLSWLVSRDELDESIVLHQNR